MKERIHTKKRIFLIVLDSFGIGAMPDAEEYGDKGVNTLKSVMTSPFCKLPNMEKLGLYHIDGVANEGRNAAFKGVCARMTEASKGKDTTIGHWEIAGVCSKNPLPTFPNGFPKEFLDRFSQKVNRGVICNQTYSGTEVIKDYGQQHMNTGDLIVYTSADSVFQIAAHEEVVPLKELYHYCEIAREMLVGELGVGRVIARPFTTKNEEFVRTSNRHDYSLLPPSVTMLDQLMENGLATIGIGKIKDIFAGKGISEYTYTGSNEEGIKKTLEYMDQEFEGLCFINLVDFDMLYGHRNNIEGYAKALAYFDEQLEGMLGKLGENDLLMITADHGCDPGYAASTDHSREYTPFLMYGPNLEPQNLGTRKTFADIGATVLQYFGIAPKFDGDSML